MKSQLQRRGRLGRSTTARWLCWESLELRRLLASVPVAVADAYLMTVGGVLDTTARGLRSVLANDMDADGDALQARTRLEWGPGRGELTINDDGSFVCTSEDPSAPTDGFRYWAYDGTGFSVSTTVTIHMLANQPHVVTSFAGIAPQCCEPTDPTAAAGPANLVAAVNSHLAIFNKDGTQVAAAAFTRSTHGNDAMFEHIDYDTPSNPLLPAPLTFMSICAVRTGHVGEA